MHNLALKEIKKRISYSIPVATCVKELSEISEKDSKAILDSFFFKLIGANEYPLMSMVKDANLNFIDSVMNKIMVGGLEGINISILNDRICNSIYHISAVYYYLNNINSSDNSIFITTNIFGLFLNINTYIILDKGIDKEHYYSVVMDSFNASIVNIINNKST